MTGYIAEKYNVKQQPNRKRELMVKRSAILLVLILYSLSPVTEAAPRLVSVFPPGGRQGTTFEVEIHGEHLEGAHSVLFDGEQLRAYVKSVEEVELTHLAGYEEDTKENKANVIPGHRAALVVEVDRAAPLGLHSVRLVSTGGVSNALKFFVNTATVVTEGELRSRNETQQALHAFPVVINGRLDEPGEVDRYFLEAKAGQELMFEVQLGDWPPKRTPMITLYEQSGSWFDADRLRRLTSNSRTVDHLPRLAHRFEESSRYVVEIGALDEGYVAIPNFGGPGYTYQLHILPAADVNDSMQELHARAGGANPWQSEGRERDFARKLDAGWIEEVLRRAPPGQSTEATLTWTKETEPNDSQVEALNVAVPGIVEGVIQSRDDIDIFKLQVGEGQKLAFEIETPDLPPPHFNPRLAVLEAGGMEVVTNLFKEVGGDGDDWVKTVEAKVIHSFETAGEYTLRISDLTSRAAGPEFTYRVLIRPQTPHVGEVRVGVDHMNLGAGRTGKLNVVVEREEGFEGEIALLVDNLPPGVTVLAASEPKKDVPPPLGSITIDRFRPERGDVALVLYAAPEAPATVMPWLIRLSAIPIMQGNAGQPFFVREVPLMVLK